MEPEPEHAGALSRWLAGGSLARSKSEEHRQIAEQQRAQARASNRQLREHESELRAVQTAMVRVRSAMSEEQVQRLAPTLVLLQLTDEVLLHVARHVGDAESLLRLKLTCKRFYAPCIAAPVMAVGVKKQWLDWEKWCIPEEAARLHLNR